MEYKLTLVLGAGASIAMGYPIGDSLRKSILDDSLTVYSDYICNEDDHIFEDELEHFINTFRSSQMSSIDAFLARRSEFSKIGKRAIAAILLDKEEKELLDNNSHNDHWYAYFFNKIAAAQTWSELSFRGLAVITFNYDRSFEHYLINALMHSYGKTRLEAFGKLKEMAIIHVYGSLGTCDPSDKNYVKYGENITVTNVSLAAKSLKVIPEGRDDDEVLDDVRHILSNSHNIAFLGFGFDKTNLERLHANDTCNEKTHHEGQTITRKIIATTYGMTPAESLAAGKSTYRSDVDRYAHQMEEQFLNTKCINLLRETLILDEL